MRALARRRGLSQEQLGERVGMSQSALSRRLTGDVAFDTAEIAAIARALDVSVGELITREATVDA